MTADALTRPRLALLCGLLFVSGVASLVFQVVWMRGFGVILGNTTYSLSCVVTVFMLGLATGSLAMSQALRGAARLAPPLVLYGVLELLAGATALAASVALFRAESALLPLTAGAAAPLAWRMATQFGVCLLVIGVPTTLMGATLPVVSTLATDARQVATLYGFNTLGAALGSLVASFVLISNWGCVHAAEVAAALDALLFAAAFGLRRKYVASSSAADAASTSDDPDPEDARLGLSAPLMLALAGFSGFVALSCEIVWTRFLELCLGNRVYVTSVALALILLFLGQAARMSARLLRGETPVWRLLLTACALSVVSLGLALAIEAPAFLGAQRGLIVLFILLLVVFPTTTVGLLLPIALAARPRGRAGRGNWVGLAYGVNTLASLAGSLLGGYVLIDALGSNGTMAFDAGLLLLAAVALAVAHRARLEPRDLALAGAALIAFIALALPNSRRSPPVVDPKSAVVSSEDAHGIFNVVDAGSGKLRVLQNRTDLIYLFGDPVTQFVQESQAFLPALFAPRLDEVLNIGAGYGITAGAFTRIAQVQHLDAVEIVPAMAAAAPLFHSGNAAYERDPRVHLTVEDGRYFLATAKARYDIISVNMTDPYLPGSSSMFSAEFYDLVREHLAPGGVLAQHIFGPDVASLYRGIARVFPYLRAIPSYANGLTVVAGLEPLEEHQRPLFEREYDHGRTLLAPIGMAGGLDTLDGLLGEGDARLAGLAATPGTFANSDVYPVLEFRRIPGELGYFYSHN